LHNYRAEKAEIDGAGKLKRIYIYIVYMALVNKMENKIKWSLWKWWKKTKPFFWVVPRLFN